MIIKIKMFQYLYSYSAKLSLKFTVLFQFIFVHREIFTCVEHESTMLTIVNKKKLSLFPLQVFASTDKNVLHTNSISERTNLQFGDRIHIHPFCC